MNEEQMEAFRLRFRLAILERLLLRTALFQHSPLRLETLSASRDALKAWLETNSSIADSAFGAHFQEPAQTALYADEVRAIIDGLQALVDRLADELDRAL